MSNDEYTVNWVYWEDPEKSIENIAGNLVITPIHKVVVEEIKDKVKEGVKKAPILKQVYKMGEYDGKKDGYTEASEKYEDKLIRQLQEFVKKENEHKATSKEKEDLLNEYEAYIEEKETIIDQLTDEQLKLLEIIKEMKNKI
jgi:hypothetical protein